MAAVASSSLILRSSLSIPVTVRSDSPIGASTPETLLASATMLIIFPGTKAPTLKARTRDFNPMYATVDGAYSNFAAFLAKSFGKSPILTKFGR